MELRVYPEQPEHLPGRTIRNVESSDDFRPEELEQSMSPGKHEKRIHDRCEAFIWVALIGGMFFGAFIMDLVHG